MVIQKENLIKYENQSTPVVLSVRSVDNDIIELRVIITHHTAEDLVFVALKDSKYVAKGQKSCVDWDSVLGITPIKDKSSL